jgi:hypothetical protein
MIGPDLVRARRRTDKLLLQELKGQDRQRAIELGAELLDIARAHLDESHEALEAALSAVDREAREEKLFMGLRKLVLDACRFDAPLEVDPVAIRRELFGRAAAERLRLEPGDRLDRERILSDAGTALGISGAQVEQSLFGDLRGAAQMIEAPSLSPEELASQYEVAQIQGILLRAVRVTLLVTETSPEAYRLLFRKLKFRQLLFKIERLEGGQYRIEIDGPFSLFDSVTKYGQKLALLVPVLLLVHRCSLSAELRWGKERKKLTFNHEFSSHESAEVDEASPEVSDLIERINEGKQGYVAGPDASLVDLPGVGVVVVDFFIETPKGARVLVEVLGFWSRDAVFRRVEWANARRAGSDRSLVPVLFAVSSRLRVKDEVLDPDTSAALYVYKGRMSAKALCERAEALT